MNSDRNKVPVGWASRPPFFNAVGGTPTLRGLNHILHLSAFATHSLVAGVNAQIQTANFSSNREEDSKSLLLLCAIVFSLVILMISVLTKKYRALWIALASLAVIASLLYFRS